MSYMIAVPDMLSSAAGDLASIGSSINASTRAAAAATTRLLPAAADEVSAHIAALFSGHGEGYQAIARQMAAFHDQFTLALTSSAGAYASAEATNVEQQVLGLINAPTQALWGRPLIGNGADGTAANPNGQAGGLLIGKGGTVVITGLADPAKLTVHVSGTDLTLHEKTIKGSLFGSCNPQYDIVRLLRLYDAGQLMLDELVTTTYNLEQVNQGYQDLRDGKNIRGVIVH